MPGRLCSRFTFAFAGLKAGFLSEENIRIEMGLALCAVTVSTALKLSALEFAILTSLTGLVLALEYLNTGIEWLTNLYQPQISPIAKLVKDSAAASVLIASIGSIVVALFLWLPRIILFLRHGLMYTASTWIGLIACLVSFIAYFALLKLLPLKNKEMLMLDSAHILEES